jgi:hypothetical protein
MMMVVPVVVAVAVRPDRGCWQLSRRRDGMRQVPGDQVQLALRLRGEGGVEPVIELIQRQPALRVMLAQASRGCFTIGISDAQVGSIRHLILRIPGTPRSSARRYIANLQAATPSTGKAGKAGDDGEGGKR